MAFIKNPEVMYKLGVTHFKDANERFSKETAEKYGFVNDELTDDYRPVPILSRWLPRIKAHELEISFRKKIPKTIWTDKMYNGITECRYLTPQQADAVIENLRREFPLEKYGGQNEGKPNYIKVYFYKFVKKVIYDTED
jgi:hypothetical protein